MVAVTHGKGKDVLLKLLLEIWELDQNLFIMVLFELGERRVLG